MNAKDFLQQYGVEEADRVAAKAGTNHAYFLQLVAQTRRPSAELARRLVEASGGRLDFVCLLQTTKKPPKRRANMSIPKPNHSTEVTL